MSSDFKEIKNRMVMIVKCLCGRWLRVKSGRMKMCAHCGALINADYDSATYRIEGPAS